MGIFDVPHSMALLTPLLVTLSTILHIPVASVLASVDGAVSRILGPLLFFAKSDLQRVAAITGFFFFMTYTFTAGLSLTGAALGNREGYRNKEPRLAKYNLEGLPHRLTALHDNLLEVFPAFIMCAAITLALPIYGVDHLVVERSINYLLLAAFSKTCVYVPAYAAGFDTIRSFAHLMAIGSLLGLLIGILTA